MTLGEMIDNALVRANVIRRGQTASSGQATDATRLFNGLMARYEADGAEIGDFPLTTTTDTLDIEREHEDPIEAIFALRLQAFFGLPLEQGLIAEATTADKFLLRNTACKPDWNLSHTPLGGATRPGSDILNG